MRTPCKKQENTPVDSTRDIDGRETVLLRILAASLLRKAGASVECVIENAKEREGDWLKPKEGAF